MATQMNLCLIGAGRMGRLRVPLFEANRRVNIVSIVDPYEPAGRSLAEACGATYYTSLEAALSAGTLSATAAEEEKESGSLIDAVWISTPTFTHEEAITQAAAAGLPIFTEKPVAETAADIIKLFQIAKNGGVPLCCGFQRRFDTSYVECAKAVRAGSVGNPTMVQVFFGDHPAPPMSFLKKGGDPFMDLSPHDLDFVRWAIQSEPVEVFASGCSSTAELAEAGVLDNAMMYVKFENGTMCNMFMSRGATYGYDQRCEFFGDQGMVRVGNQTSNSCTRADVEGYHHAPLQYSFPQRFHQAFSAEVDAFADVVLCGAQWPVTMRDCAIVQAVASAGSRACRDGTVVQLSMTDIVPPPSSAETAASAVSLRFVGCGSFGSYISGLVSSADVVREHRLRLLEPFTRSSGMDWETDVLSSSDVEAVYICTPDKLHKPQAIACLRAGKHVLVEKPVAPDFDDVLAALHPEGPVLVVGFHRRFAAEFLRAKEALSRSATAPRRIKIESRDPVPADPNMPFVVCNSMCHDVDMISWLFPGSMITWETGAYDAADSSVVLRGTVAHPSGEATRVVIEYNKVHPMYVQRLVVDGACFGYEQEPDGHGGCTVYADAYAAQWEFFTSLCAAAIRPVAGQAAPETPQETKARINSYSRTFMALAAALKVLELPVNPYVDGWVDGRSS